MNNRHSTPDAQRQRITNAFPHMKKLILALLALAFAAILSGCQTRSAKDSTIPWGRPADWEGGIPGMGDPTDQR